MELVSIYFVISSVIALFIFYLFNHKYRMFFLTVLSCCFIGSLNTYLLIYVVIFTLLNYLIGLRIPLAKNRKAVFRTGIITNLFQLIILKYASFTIDPLFTLLNLNIEVKTISKIIVPIGISFFTLQAIGYLINIYMNWEKPEKNFANFLLYITFYPKFLSGPIERSNHFLPQLKSINDFDKHNIIDGLRMVLFGFFKKVAIANQLFPLINGVYTNLNSYEGLTLWLVILIQPLYIYFDFSGYTDIALGLAKTFGIELLPNFNRPFLSENVSTFWKRFHISLSSWFNDYVFRQTSFKYRKWGVNASVFAVFVTWILFGIWHGAGWNFMLLGVLQAAAINYEFFTKKWRVNLFLKFNSFFRVWIGRILTYAFYGFSLIFFFSPDINFVFNFFSRLKYLSGPMLTDIKSEIFFLVLIFILIFIGLEVLKNDFTDIYIKIESFWGENKSNNKVFRWAIYFSIITIVLVFSNEVQQFIYFKF